MARKQRTLLTMTEHRRGTKAQHAAYKKTMRRSMRRARVANLGMHPNMTQIYRGSTRAADAFRAAKTAGAPKGHGTGKGGRQRRDRRGRFA